ncbi:MAG: hypothetical protein KKA67_11970 [Spirochaetes bacterium]|nr:hypothetical protein [Spirochaetota bacterium]MBU1080696.1 hypothetical protein [Spirochaetota bacterium]
MRDFRTLLHSKTGFIPKTEAQALRGYSEGILSPEYYIYLAVNIHPILEEPWDVREIDRLLAKSDLDADTAALLMTVFGRMVKSKDKELALFAAESVNALERRFVERVQALRKKLDSDRSAPPRRAVIAEYRTLARLFSSFPVLGSFYLDEARRFFVDNRRILVDPDLDIAVYLEILMDRREFELAAKVSRAALDRWPENRRLRLAAAKLAFARKRIREVIGNLERLGGPAAGSPDSFDEPQLFWTRGACRE